ncbi:MAG TPA: ribosome maturation factor RimM [Kofleriaceae bacterium]|nr:ribosome maturation factor RimM [Kofleriaceae bacterium]
MAGPHTEIVEIGYVARAHGVTGELRVVCHNPASTALLRADAVTVGGRRYVVDGVRSVDGAFLVALADVSDRDAAEALRGQTVSVDRGAIELPPGEFLLADLIGCRALDSAGNPLGVVVDVEAGAQDRLVIADGDQEWMLPLVPAFLRSVDLEHRTITLDPPSGLPREPARKR